MELFSVFSGSVHFSLLSVDDFLLLIFVYISEWMKVYYMFLLHINFYDAAFSLGVGGLNIIEQGSVFGKKLVYDYRAGICL